MTGTISAATATPIAGVTGRQAQSHAPTASRDDVPISMRINGQPYQFSVDARTSLLDLIRDHAGLTGTKKGCDHGQCGACTALTEGRRTLFCIVSPK
ncbi:2Fe-2S iron-sulfur cluster-binding protein [Neorhizobium sp. 2083]|uniref:(2Fe-2S)-binding protein n=1 Tax=Neorhizobium sp. 2083 TaxID=2817762 RepID=UPI00286A7E8A|nr:2Fe-2S iron-sulfur cluster-binding protein [Neorhizobium sp. 2083]